MNKFLDTYYVEELDHDFTVRIDFYLQPAEPDVGIMNSYIEHISIEFMYAEGWTAVELVGLDESTINDKCWAFLKMVGESREEAKAEYVAAKKELNRMELCEDEKLYLEDYNERT